MADNIVCHCSLLGCLFGWRAGSIGELTPVNGQQMWTERLMFRELRGRTIVMTTSLLFIVTIKRKEYIWQSKKLNL